MPPKKKGKKKSKKQNKKVEKGEDSLSLSSPIPLQPQIPSIGNAVFSSLSQLPVTIIKNASKTYVLLMNKAVEKYLAMAGVTPDIDGKALDEQILKSSDLFSKGMKIVGVASKEMIKDGAKITNAILNDDELKSQIKKMQDAITEMSKVQLKSLLQIGDEALPLVRAKADEVVDIAEKTQESIGKAGIRAGLNAAQAVPGAGQVISVVRMIHAVTMPAFKLFERMTNLMIDTLNKVMDSAERVQPGLTLGLDKAVGAFVAAKDAQQLAAKKIMAMSNKVESKINETSNKINNVISKINVPQQPKLPQQPKIPQQPKLPQAAGRRKRRRKRTRKKALKKKHRRKSRRRMRY